MDTMDTSTRSMGMAAVMTMAMTRTDTRSTARGTVTMARAAMMARSRRQKQMVGAALFNSFLGTSHHAANRGGEFEFLEIVACYAQQLSLTESVVLSPVIVST